MLFSSTPSLLSAKLQSSSSFDSPSLSVSLSFFFSLSRSLFFLRLSLSVSTSDSLFFLHLSPIICSFFVSPLLSSFLPSLSHSLALFVSAFPVSLPRFLHLYFSSPSHLVLSLLLRFVSVSLSSLPSPSYSLAIFVSVSHLPLISFFLPSPSLRQSLPLVSAFPVSLPCSLRLHPSLFPLSISYRGILPPFVLLVASRLEEGKDALHFTILRFLRLCYAMLLLLCFSAATSLLLCLVFAVVLCLLLPMFCVFNCCFVFTSSTAAPATGMKGIAYGGSKCS